MLTGHMGKNRLKGKGEHTTNDETFCTFSVFKWYGSLFELMIQCHLVLSDSSKFKDSGLILRGIRVVILLVSYHDPCPILLKQKGFSVKVYSCMPL